MSNTIGIFEFWKLVATAVCGEGTSLLSERSQHVVECMGAGEFCQWSSRIELNYGAPVSVEIVAEIGAGEVLTDDAGNKWIRLTMRYQVSWPSVGSVDVDRATKFEAAVNACVHIAALVKSVMEDKVIVAPFKTAVQVADDEQKRRDRQNKEKAEKLAHKLAKKYMRIGKRESRDKASFQDQLPDEGVYKVKYENSDKEYIVTVDDVHVHVTRV
jgi:hypothetical protein